MTQRAVEQAIGRLVTDERFRQQFARDPGAACRALGLELAPYELRALAVLPLSLIERMVAAIDDRIRHLTLPFTLDQEIRP